MAHAGGHAPRSSGFVKNESYSWRHPSLPIRRSSRHLAHAAQTVRSSLRLDYLMCLFPADRPPPTHFTFARSRSPADFKSPFASCSLPARPNPNGGMLTYTFS
jgi:hypothetical protein